MLTQYYYILFGVVAVVGGALGYARAKSIASVVAGGISGGLLVIAGLIGPSVAARWLALIVSLLLLAYFGPSYLRKRKAMPAIPMILLSLVCIVLTARHWFK
ncbi:MAG TPA: TMEM14 family protein [Chthoniobacterales bacterium]|jgi:uncharacterized membrane protein (UPF0136 family)|nr:TMEM14 family protein [Chthoniobacterales bacterium]